MEFAIAQSRVKIAKTRFRGLKLTIVASLVESHGYLFVKIAKTRFRGLKQKSGWGKGKWQGYICENSKDPF